MIKLKLGDTVRCTIKQYYHFQMLGKIVKIHKDKTLPYDIRWMEGIVPMIDIRYGYDELKLVCNKDRNCKNCKHKLKCITS